MAVINSFVSLSPKMDLDTKERRDLPGGGIRLDDNSRAYNKNVMAELDNQNKPFSVQRPGLEEYYTKPTSDLRGRGIYTWLFGTTGIAVIGVIGDDIFNIRTGALLGSFTSANNEPVFFAEIGDYLVIADTTELRVVDNTLTVTPATPGIGGVIAGMQSLNGILYLFHEDGTIENSALGDPFTWNPLDFITAERDNDRGLALMKHHDHLVAIGEHTIEFFYDAGNPTGSPLARRQDISFNTGTLYPTSVSEYGDIIYLLTREASGGIQLGVIENFNLRIVSDSKISRYLTTVLTLNFNLDEEIGDTQGQSRVVLSSTGWGNHQFLFMTFVNAQQGGSAFAYVVLDTLVYDKYTGLFHNFISEMPQASGGLGFPFIGWTKGRSRVLEDTIDMFKVGMTTSGNILRFRQDGIPVDTNLTATMAEVEEAFYAYPPSYTVDDFDYWAAAGAYPVEVVLRTEEWEADDQYPVANRNKFLYNLEPDITTVRPYEDLPSAIFVRWTDDDYQTYSSFRSVQVDDDNRRLPACGRFRRRAFEIRYIGLNQLRFEDLELSLRISSYA